jgi:iron complex outermembrane recepter protein
MLSFRRRWDSKILTGCIVISSLLRFGSESAFAQPAINGDAATEKASGNETLGEVIVTARRREESALTIPGAITAISGQDLDAENAQSIDDLTAITPGLVRDSTTTGAARADRSFQSLIIRGMTPASGNNVTSVFVNGVPVADGNVDGVFDFDHIEVLKGPQSAYFGRETFAGAINFVTKDPGNDFRGYASALAASDNYYDVKTAFEGPIVPDVISFRLSARYYSREGTWDNGAEPGQQLGGQGTKSGSLQLNIKPLGNLSIKLYGVYWQDNDGPGPTGVILPSQSNCQFQGGPYFCGTLPGLLPGQPSINTAYNAGTAAQLAATGNVLRPNFLDHWGLERHAYHSSSSIDYKIPSLGLTLSSLTGRTDDAFGTFFPLNGIASTIPNVFGTGPYAQPYTNWPFIVQSRNSDLSQEFRVASDQTQRLRWLMGTSYLWTSQRTGGASNYYFGGLTPPTLQPPGQTTTYGVFYSLAFDVMPDLTLDLDGRYQSDRLVSRLVSSNAIGNEAEYHNFAPRVSLEYRFMKDAMAYFVYSRGINPGIATDPLLEFRTQADVQRAIAAGATSSVKPEYVDNYELGVKGRFLDNRLAVAADVYYDIWTHKIVSDDLLLVNPGGAPSYVTFYTNLGKVVLPGIEVEITAKPFENYVVNASGAINASRIEAGQCPSCQLLTGSNNVNGNQLPNYSKYSAQAYGVYTQVIAPLPKFNWYERTEVTYESGQYESYGDYAKSPAATNVNFRLGIRGEQVSIEGFVTNAFNNKAYTSLLNQWNLSNPAETYAAYDAVYVGLPFLRTYGARVRYDF